jgi:hypothetical protein
MRYDRDRLDGAGRMTDQQLRTEPALYGVHMGAEVWRADVHDNLVGVSEEYRQGAVDAMRWLGAWLSGAAALATKLGVELSVNTLPPMLMAMGQREADGQPLEYELQD